MFSCCAIVVLMQSYGVVVLLCCSDVWYCVALLLWCFVVNFQNEMLKIFIKEALRQKSFVSYPFKLFVKSF